MSDILNKPWSYDIFN